MQLLISIAFISCGAHRTLRHRAVNIISNMMCMVVALRMLGISHSTLGTEEALDEDIFMRTWGTFMLPVMAAALALSPGMIATWILTTSGTFIYLTINNPVWIVRLIMAIIWALASCWFVMKSHQKMLITQVLVYRANMESNQIKLEQGTKSSMGTGTGKSWQLPYNSEDALGDVDIFDLLQQANQQQGSACQHTLATASVLDHIRNVSNTAPLAQQALNSHALVSKMKEMEQAAAMVATQASPALDPRPDTKPAVDASTGKMRKREAKQMAGPGAQQECEATTQAKAEPVTPPDPSEPSDHSEPSDDGSSTAIELQDDVEPGNDRKRPRSGENDSVKAISTIAGACMQLGAIQWKRLVSPQFLSICQDVLFLSEQHSAMVLAGCRLEPLLQKLGAGNLQAGMRMLTQHLQQHLTKATHDEAYEYSDVIVQADGLQMAVSGSMLRLQGSSHVVCSIKDISQLMYLTNLCNMLMAANTSASMPKPSAGLTAPPVAATRTSPADEMQYHMYDAFSFSVNPSPPKASRKKQSKPKA